MDRRPPNPRRLSRQLFGGEKPVVRPVLSFQSTMEGFVKKRFPVNFIRVELVIPETIDASLFSLASQERLAELEEKEQAEGGSTEATQQEKAKLRRSISRSALKRSNTERCPKTPLLAPFSHSNTTIYQDRLRTNTEKFEKIEFLQGD